jgi:glycosyltransferase involved in cell wall biosynthesis
MLFALPSRDPEGLGLVFLEAMACGRPVIATKSGGVPEIVLDGKNGLLVDRNEPEEWACAIRRLLCDAAARERIGEFGRTEVANLYSWPRVAANYLNVYASCAKVNRDAGVQGRGER